VNSSPENDPAPAPGPSTRTQQQSHWLAVISNTREVIARGQALFPGPAEEAPRWSLHLERLDAMEALLRAGSTGDDARFQELREEFFLDFQADQAAAVANTSARLVRSVDKIVQHVEDKKFEVDSDSREAMEDLLEPYTEHVRDEMLDILPIAERHRIEEEKRQLEGGDTSA
jgi:hypothetical protein